MKDKELKQFIIQISAEAGEYLRNHFYTFKNVIEHGSGNLITNIDVELTEILRKRISQQYPNHQIIFDGESIKPEAEYVWLVDPLEGSSHFSRNIPVYTVNIALQKSGQTMMATVNHPQTHQLFFAEIGQGAYLNGIKIKTSDQKVLASSYIFVELPEKKFDQHPDFDAKMKQVTNLVKNCKQVETFRIGSFGQCLVASGSFDAYVDLSGTSQSLSQAAAQLILKEAGGEIVDLGQTNNDFIQIMATNSLLTKELNKIINE